MIQKLSFFNYHLRLHQRFLGKHFCNKKNPLFYKTFHLTSLILKYDIAPFAFTSWNINRHHLLFLLICAAIRNILSSFMKDLFIRRLRIDSERTWHLKKTIELIGKISERWFTTFLVYRWLSKRSFLFVCLFVFPFCTMLAETNTASILVFFRRRMAQNIPPFRDTQSGNLWNTP